MALWQWSKTPATNATADPTINWAEGQPPSTVNDSARAMMAVIASNRDDKGGAITAGGTATALTFSSNSGIAATPTDGQRLTMRMPFANGIAPTMTVDGGNTYPLQSAAGVAMGTGVMVSGGIYDISFNVAAVAWIVVAAFIGNVAGPASSVAGHIATFADVTGKNLADGGALGPLAQQQTILTANLAPDAAPLPFVAPQTADNLLLSNDGTNPTRDVDISRGRVRDDTDVANLRLMSTMVKRLDTSFVAGGLAGSPQGGCDTGSKGANQTWHAYVIGNLAQAVTQYSRTGTTVTLTFGANHNLGAGGTARVIGINSIGGAQGFDGNFPIASVPSPTTLTYTSAVNGTIGTTAAPAGTTCDGFDCLFSQSYPSPTMPANWTVKQCIGSILTDGGSNILAFTQIGNDFLLAAQLSQTITLATVSRALLASGCPLGLSMEVKLRIFIAAPGVGTQGFAVVTSPFEADIAPVQGNCSISAGLTSGANSFTTDSEVTVFTNSSGQVGIRGNSALGFIYNLASWRDPRRRMF